MTLKVVHPPAQDLAVYYDPLSYAAFDHPYDLYRSLRDQAPVYYNERRDLWVLSRHADVSAALRNHEQLVNALGNDIDGTHDSYGVGMLVCQDPPHHTVLRDAIRPAFGRREILAMEEQTRAVSRRLLDDLRAKGDGDFTADFALPLVFDVALRLVGAPAADAPYFIAHLRRAMARTVGKFGLPHDAVAANEESEEHLSSIVAHRREAMAAGEEASGGDALSHILLAVERGSIDDAEVIGLAHLVLSASTDAPAALLSNCVAVLDKFPALQRHLAEQPQKIPNFIEEVLRYETPAQNLARQTTAEVTIGGVTIPRDSRVMLLTASANRDERVFEDPDRFDVDRVFSSEAKILTFGEGIHTCLGAPLMRLIARVALETLLDGTEFRIVGTPERWAKQMVRGFASLPVEFITRSRPLEKLAGAVKHHTTKLTLTAAHRELVTEVHVDRKDVVAEDVVALTLRPTNGDPLPPWEAGAHVDLILPDASTRQYSLSGDPADASSWRLGILRDAEGSGSSLYVHDRLQVGDLVQVRGPRNNFSLIQSPRYLFIAGGIGITPILPMIRAAEAAGATWQLLYGGRRRASMAFLDELSAYGQKVIIQPQDETGLLDLDSVLGVPQPETKVYCCGPEPLLSPVEERCRAWPRGSLHVERFVPKPLAEPRLATAFEVHLVQSNVTVTVPPDRSILDVVEEAGIETLSSCREGTCGSCEAVVLEGTPDHRDSVLDEERREANDCMMICVSRSCTDRLVLDL